MKVGGNGKPYLSKTNHKLLHNLLIESFCKLAYIILLGVQEYNPARGRKVALDNRKVIHTQHHTLILTMQ